MESERVLSSLKERETKKDEVSVLDVCKKKKKLEKEAQNHSLFTKQRGKKGKETEEEERGSHFLPP